VGTIRQLADRFTTSWLALDPTGATFEGVTGHDTEVTDWSPDGIEARTELLRTTLRELAGLDPGFDPLERRCGRLLQERLEARLALAEAGEPYRELTSMYSPPQMLRQAFDLMPTATTEDWAVVAERLERTGEGYDSYVAGLREGAWRDLFAAPRQVAAVVAQLDELLEMHGGTGWFHGHVAGGPERLRSRLDDGATSAAAGMARLRDFLRDEYLPAAEGTPDAVGADRYAAFARFHNGVDLDLDEAYEFGWSEVLRLRAEQERLADEILPGSGVLEAMDHLDAEGEAVEGEAALVSFLEGLVHGAIDDLDGKAFTIRPELRRIDVGIPPLGGAAAPYYDGPSEDFSRPGTTWFPTLGRTRFPLWEVVCTWYHEGVPGHHLQLATWVALRSQLSSFQTGIGGVSSNTEGWALYAERLMDELGYFTDPGRRMGYLVGQQLRAVRVAVDIGIHTGRTIPDGQPFHPGERWTTDVASEFVLGYGGNDPEMLTSEVVRYLGWPGQAITYKLGERAWLEGRRRATERHGSSFDLRAWHDAALGLGSLGLGDLVDELASL
jgi:uncharacterized protein (DUF885 family)